MTTPLANPVSMQMEHGRLGSAQAGALGEKAGPPPSRGPRALGVQTPRLGPPPPPGRGGRGRGVEGKSEPQQDEASPSHFLLLGTQCCNNLGDNLKMEAHSSVSHPLSLWEVLLASVSSPSFCKHTFPLHSMRFANRGCPAFRGRGSSEDTSHWPGLAVAFLASQLNATSPELETHFPTVLTIKGEICSQNKGSNLEAKDKIKDQPPPTSL